MSNNVAPSKLPWKCSGYGFAAFALIVVCLVGSPVDTISCIFTACGRNALRIQALQLEGGRRLTVQEFLAGHHLTPGQRLE
jgi:hypothetical protein